MSKLDRWLAHGVDALAISGACIRPGAELASLQEHLDTTSAMVKFFFHDRGGFGELEREQIAERTSVAMQQHQTHGGA